MNVISLHTLNFVDCLFKINVIQFESIELHFVHIFKQNFHTHLIILKQTSFLFTVKRYINFLFLVINFVIIVNFQIVIYNLCKQTSELDFLLNFFKMLVLKKKMK